MPVMSLRGCAPECLPSPPCLAVTVTQPPPTPPWLPGMTWRAFRPSGAPAAFGYSIPTNAYIAGALQRALRLNARVWRSGEFEAAATKLLGDIQQGALLEAAWGSGLGCLGGLAGLRADGLK